MNATTLEIRTGTAAELTTIAGFWLAMFEEVGNIAEAQMLPDWRERFVAYFERRIGEGTAVLFVAVDGDSIVGTTGAILPDWYPAAVHGIRYGYIFGVRVEPSHRRQGVAERLVREATSFLQESGCARVRLHASRFGRGLYERLGFVPTNEMELLPS